MESKRLKVGIVGCGTIGSEIARACQNRLKNKIELAAICDADEKKTAALNEILNKKVRVLKFGDLIKKCDFVVEAASAKISADLLNRCIKNKKSCLIMSVGGLLGNEKLLELARSKGVKVYIPSGAICGIDGLKSASVGEIESVTITTRKPFAGLVGAPYLIQKGIDVVGLKKETVVFEGTAADAVKGFPQNINVSAVLSIAGIGSKDTRVRIVASPDCKSNIHEVEIVGEFGKIATRCENVPSKANSKTSALAIFSAIATLEGAILSVHVGT
ncbi:MAG: aspartate dehydrogenase [Candidatus Omnitrophota bacterium]|nr:aspartate dehydrogenase [Candidatus Omnitrophota bacterium]